MKKIWIAIGIIIIIGGLVGVNIWKQSSEGNVSVEVATLTEETISETVLTPGTLKLDDEQTVYFQADKGEIAEVFIKEGDSIEKGEKLVRYENKQLLLEEKQNELQLRSGYLQIENIRERHKEIDKQLEEDKDNEMLQSEHDEVYLQEQQANIELEQTQLQKDAIEKQIEELVVKSDIDGTVVTIDEQAASGSEQMQQKPLIRIGSLNKLVVEGVISEYDTLKIEKNQPVILKSDVVPDKSWKGNVSLVSYLPKEADDTNMMDGGTSGVQYAIEVVVEDKNIDLKPGFQMLIEIETNKQKSNTLPLSAVKQEGDNNFVYVVTDGKAEQREITVGTVSGEQIEISDGLNKKEKVIIDLSDDVKDGLEVTIK